MSRARFQLGTVVSHPFEENTYLAHLEGRNDCLIFDPGFEPHKIFEYLDERKLTPAAILCTHGHGDHIGGNADMKERWPDCPLMIGAGDAEFLTDPILNMSAMLGLELISPPADRLLLPGEKLNLAGFELEIREIPGHSPGHIVFVWHATEAKQDQPTIVFGGDVLFQRSIGRTDFPYGSFEQLRDGIHQKLFDLPDDTIVLPGHGSATTIGEEKESNPFVGLHADFSP